MTEAAQAVTSIPLHPWGGGGEEAPHRLLGSQVNKPDPQPADMASPSSGDPSKASLPPPPLPPPGPSVSQEIRFPDIYGGDTQLWEAHFRGIGRAYRALGKGDDFTIRVLTEDFTLPFPFAWPPGPDPANGPLFYDPHDRTGFDFLLQGPGALPPALLRPLHSTAQAALRKRQLERLALSYAQAGRGPGPEAACCCPAPSPTSPGLQHRPLQSRVLGASPFPDCASNSGGWTR
ncbi:uncharacterized protein C8orf90 homolog [Artibeus jamaicensis]|uniref:uncharacterized protein C8orf90 homolog n=1 Tax=Artibeus jamaicensis TaxID=9417 RepID=UPI00235A4C40|nr:uncharacterized protein C8orf90 homolog [Artibeus jamaicensis]